MAPFCTFANEKSPSTLVTLPVPVPFTMTLAPMMGSPFSSFTFPVTVTCCCANAFTEMNSNKAQQARMSLHERFSFLFMIRLIVNISF